MRTVSAVEVAHDPGTPDLGPEYHVSISMLGERCSTADALWVLAQYRQSKSGLLGAAVDNRRGGFVAQINAYHRNHYLGHFDTAEAAHAVYIAAKRRLHNGNTL